MAKAKWPDRWLMTDERMGEQLWPALERLPPGAGIVLRHHRHPDRAKLAEGIASIAERRALVLAIARDVDLARTIGAPLVHNPSSPAGALAISLSVHSLAEADTANAAGATLAFVSPLFATRSHAGAAPLSRGGAAEILERLKCPGIALGGVNARNYPEIEDLGFSGWAGIDAWL